MFPKSSIVKSTSQVGAMHHSTDEPVAVSAESRVALCALCRQVASLRRSHLLPASLYKTVHGTEKNPHPLHINPVDWRQSSVQDVATLLCDTCEQLIHCQGENWVLRHLLRRTGRFRLLDMVEKWSQSVTVDQYTVYSINSGSPIDFGALAYFAASVIWKASVHKWQSYGQGKNISLGNVYQEKFRRYLLGETRFPDDAVFIMDVTRPENRLKEVLCSPATSRGDKHYRHWFMTPGVIFEIAVGRLMSDAVRGLCALRHRLILSSNHENAVRLLYNSMGK